MWISARVDTRRAGRIPRSMAIATLLLLAACANGDFGEVKPSLVRDDIHD